MEEDRLNVRLMVLNFHRDIKITSEKKMLKNLGKNTFRKITVTILYVRNYNSFFLLIINK